MNAEPHRTAFVTSRRLEFFDQNELRTQIGQSQPKWPLALVKELLDNGLDACEATDIAPVLSVNVDLDAVTVADNGPGLPAQVLRQSLDYDVRVSDKRHYVAPTRGQLGNALKTVWAAPFAISGDHGLVEVWAHGTHYAIDVTVDRIAQTPHLDLSETPGDVKNGTIVKMHWPEVASYLYPAKNRYFYNPTLRDLAAGFALCNPHMTLTTDSFEWTATDPAWRKWTATAPTSPHWYTLEDLRNLAAAYLADGQAKSVREFVSEFRGLSGSAKAKSVVDGAGLSGLTLGDLVVDGDLDTQRLGVLLALMKAGSRPVNPDALGVIGEAHFVRWMQAQGAAAESIVYRKCTGCADGLPYVLEMAFGVSQDDNATLRQVAGLNWTPALDVPFVRMSELLGTRRVDPHDPVIVAVHLACPKLAFTDRGKSRIVLPDALNADFEKAFVAVTKEWTKEKSRAARQERLNNRQLEEMRRRQRARQYTLKEAAYEVMVDAYNLASDHGALPANARQVMYKARPGILALTDGKWYGERNRSGFYNDMRAFMEEYPGLTADWDIVYDDRGHLIEPHTREQIGLGTLAVRRYISGWTNGAYPQIIAPDLLQPLSTLGPHNRYSAALFIEKEGFNELLGASGIAGRYDISIMSTKGMSVTASRQLVEHLTQQGVKILCMHDFDKAGLTIAYTLAHNTARYQFRTKPDVVDIGLRLIDVQEMGLEVGDEPFTFKDKADPRNYLRRIGASRDECNFLVHGRSGHGWYGRRVELNAMGSRQFLDFLERKLQENGVQKVVPASDEYLAAAYKRAAILAGAQAQIDRLFADLAAQEVAIPDDLRQRLTERLEGSSQSWDEALFDLAGGQS